MPDNQHFPQVQHLLEYYRKVAKVLGEEKDETANKKEGGQAFHSLLWFYGNCCASLNDLTRAYLGDPEGKKKLVTAEIEVSAEELEAYKDNVIKNGRVEGNRCPNESQKEAIWQAISCPISFVQGPPGTGKTETIMNMVSCILARESWDGQSNKDGQKKPTVAVVSRNGAALDNIAAKVSEYEKNFKPTEPNKKRVVESFAQLGNKGQREEWNRRHKNEGAKTQFHFSAEAHKFPESSSGAIDEPGWETSIKAKKFLSEYPFITSTVHSLKKCFVDGDSDEFQFDYVIVDEASQCDILAGIVAMSSAKHLVLVGDKEQLSPIYNNDLDATLTEFWQDFEATKRGEDLSLYQHYNIKDEDTSEGRSFLESCFAAFPEAPNTFLNAHYRCHPGIIGFCKKKVYEDDGRELDISQAGVYKNGELLPCGEDETPIKVLWFQGDYCEYCERENAKQNSTKETVRRTKRNLRQIQVFMEEEWPYMREKLKDPDFSICILSPFNFQIYLLLASKAKEEVVRALDWLEMCCEDPDTKKNYFKELFGLIIFDRGSEFDDIEGMERSALRVGEKRCAVYFADPSRPDQKGAAEKNHVEFRKLVPKGTSMQAMDAATLADICSHVNSSVRKGCGNASPIMLAKLVFPHFVLDNLGLREIPPKDVIGAPGILYRP